MTIFAARRRRSTEQRKQAPTKPEKKKKKKKEEKPAEDTPSVGLSFPGVDFSSEETPEIRDEKGTVKEFTSKPPFSPDELFKTPVNASEDKPEPKAEKSKGGRKKSQAVKMRDVQIYQFIKDAGAEGTKKAAVSEAVGVEKYLLFNSFDRLRDTGKIELIPGTKKWRAVADED